LARGFQTLKPRRWPEEGPRWPGFWGWPGLHISDITNNVMKDVNSRSKAEASTRRQWTTVRRLVIDQEQTKSQVGSGSNFKLDVTMRRCHFHATSHVRLTYGDLPSSSMAETRAAPFISRCPSDVQARASRRGTTRVVGRVQTKQGEKFFVSGMNDVNSLVHVSFDVSDFKGGRTMRFL
jgi:hypothetical protein